MNRYQIARFQALRLARRLLSVPEDFSFKQIQKTGENTKQGCFWRKIWDFLFALSEEIRLEQDADPVHNWFELTYSQYLTIPRTVLETMPTGWQRQFVRHLKELDNQISWRPQDDLQYWVFLAPEDCTEPEEIIHQAHQDPLQNYRDYRARRHAKSLRTQIK